MFLVDQQFRLDTPAALKSSGTDFFQLIESTMDLPVWIARVLDPSRDGSFPRYRTLLVNDASLALHVLGLPQWSERVLYALLPSYVTGLANLSIGRCGRVWKCEEPDGVGSCWRVEADGIPMLLSMCGTPLGHEINPCLVWSEVA